MESSFTSSLCYIVFMFTKLHLNLISFVLPHGIINFITFQLTLPRTRGKDQLIEEINIMSSP